MVEEQLRRRGIGDPRVLAAFAQVPRHAFVEEKDLARCYGDHPLPIGHGQTISQPYVVAYMLDAVGVGAHERVLEIGTGCGYQTALLAELAAQVRSLEYFAELALAARRRLHELGLENAEIIHGDGSLGWPQAQARFEVIVGSAAAPRVPGSLLDQLSPGGRLIMPVGAGSGQELVLVRRTPSGL